MTTCRVTFELSGVAENILREGSWPDEHPVAWRAITSMPSRRVGYGTTRTVTIPRRLADDLADYLWSVEQVNQVGEGRSGSTGKAAARTIERIVAAMKP